MGCLMSQIFPETRQIGVQRRDAGVFVERAGKPRQRLSAAEVPARTGPQAGARRTRAAKQGGVDDKRGAVAETLLPVGKTLAVRRLRYVPQTGFGALRWLAPGLVERRIRACATQPACADRHPAAQGAPCGFGGDRTAQRHQQTARAEAVLWTSIPALARSAIGNARPAP